MNAVYFSFLGSIIIISIHFFLGGGGLYQMCLISWSHGLVFSAWVMWVMEIPFFFCVCVGGGGGGGGVTGLKIPSHLSVVCLSCINAQYFGIVSVNIKDFIVKLKGFGWLMLMSDVIAIQIKSILRLDISYYVMIG